MKKFSEEEIEKMLDEYENETLIYRMYTGKGVEGMLKLSNFYQNKRRIPLPPQAEG